MKCHFCEAVPDKLLQVIFKVNADADTSAFAYKFVCAGCVDEKKMRDNVINEVSTKDN